MNDKEKEKHRQNVEIWNKAEKKHNLRQTYKLDKRSVVIDLGAYRGDWARKINNIYGCEVYCFEPVKSVYDTLNNFFAKNNKVKVINCAVGAKNEDLEILLDKDATSFFNEKGQKELVSVKNVKDIFESKGLMSADLIKMNIENSEYEVLEEMIKYDMLKNYRYFQIQFHRDADNAIERRKSIRKELAKTHRQMWNHEFIWESWERR